MNATQFELNPAHIWLEIPDTLKNKVWKKSDTQGTPAMRQRSYLNRLCQAVVLPYLQEHEPNVEALAAVEELWLLGINGTGLTLGEDRILLIPSTTWDLDEVQVPQEWVDIPELAADYHVAVQVDLEDSFMRLWGYTTHEQLKRKGDYSSSRRIYTLERDELVETIDTLWIRREHFPKLVVAEQLEAIPKPAEASLKSALAVFGNEATIFANRMVPFDTWTTLITDAQWRQQVLEHLLGAQNEQQPFTQLQQWFEQQFEPAWQAVNDLVSPQPQWRKAFRDPHDQVERAKQIDLSTGSSECQVALVLSIESTSQRLNVKTGIYPTNHQTQLPPSLRMRLITDAGELFKEVIADANASFLSYGFEAAAGDRFSVEVSLGSVCVTESFQL